MITLKEILEELPQGRPTAVVGVEPDSTVPVLWELGETHGGSVLVQSDYPLYRTLVVKSMLFSIANRLPPSQARFMVVAEDIDRYYRMRLEQHKHLDRLYGRLEAGVALMALYGTLNRRFSGQADKRPVIILVLDEINCLNTSEAHALGVILRAGPRLGIYTIGAYDHDPAFPFTTKLVEVKNGLFEVTEGAHSFKLEAILT